MKDRRSDRSGLHDHTSERLKTCVAILMVEQNANMALSIANRGYVLQTGEIVLADSAANLLANPSMQKAYLGLA